MNWLPSVLSLAMAAVTIYTPQIQSAISAHPNVATGLAAALAIFSHLMPSPVVQAPVSTIPSK